MMVEPEDALSVEALSLVGGSLCLDFVNTVDPRHSPDRAEYLIDAETLSKVEGLPFFTEEIEHAMLERLP